MGYKTIDELICHLKNNGIAITDATQKRQLINTGYFHGYKGYRFFGTAKNRLPFVSYEEIYATIQYDAQLKSLFYTKVMFIETAIKNIALDCILMKVQSENIQSMYAKAVSSYKNSPSSISIEKKKKLQQNKLNLQSIIQSYLLKAYKNDNPKITHFYNNISYNDVPLWALFEIMMLGDFGFLLSCLTDDIRNELSQTLGLNVSADTNRELIYKYVYVLKDLRNAIAHNDVIFDTRFKKFTPTKAMKKSLELEFGLPYVNFKTIGDYVILISYFLKLLNVPKSELSTFIHNFEKITDDYRKKVNPKVAGITIHPDLTSRMLIIKNHI